MEKPYRVSVIVPVHNGKGTIEECILSLLSQSYPEDAYEVIVVDNKSTDGTVAIVKKYGRVKLLQEREVQSSYAARNRGVKCARGEILAFTDADCVATREWLREMVAGFTDSQVGCVAGEVRLDPRRFRLFKEIEEAFPFSQRYTLHHPFLPYPKTANVCYHRDVFRCIGIFDPLFISGGDADLSWRMTLETDYRMVYRSSAIVYHTWPSFPEGFFQKSRKYGMGAAALYKKYRGRMKRNWRDSLLGYSYLIGLGLKVPLVWFTSGRGREGQRLRAHLLKLEYALGWKIGLIWGSVRSGVGYL